MLQCWSGKRSSAILVATRLGECHFGKSPACGGRWRWPAASKHFVSTRKHFCTSSSHVSQCYSILQVQRNAFHLPVQAGKCFTETSWWECSQVLSTTQASSLKHAAKVLPAMAHRRIGAVSAVLHECWQLFGSPWASRPPSRLTSHSLLFAGLPSAVFDGFPLVSSDLADWVFNVTGSLCTHHRCCLRSRSSVVT